MNNPVNPIAAKTALAIAPPIDQGATIIVSYLVTPLQSNISLSDAPLNPISSLYENTAYDLGFDLYVIAYVPTGSTIPSLGLSTIDGKNICTVPLEGGIDITARIFKVEYNYSGSYGELINYDVYQLHCLYQINPNDPQAQAVLVFYNDPDPVTTRGTITTVMKT